MGSSNSHYHRNDVIAYPEQISFAENHLFPKTHPCKKVVRQLNLEKKEKTGNRGVTLLNSQATIINLPKTSIPPPTELLCLPPNQNIFKKHLPRRFIYQKNFCTNNRPVHVFQGSVLY